MSTVWITGGLGCIGTHTATYLLNHTDAEVILTSRNVDASRVERALWRARRRPAAIVALDVRDRAAIDRLVSTHPITHAIHLAALQTPECNANRDLGLQVNLAGTQHVLEALKMAAPRLERVVFASSIAVYGYRREYPPGPVESSVAPRPVNVYGVWKLAGEELCRIFHQETGIPAVALRPGVLFGPGRDLGLTSTPTWAMKHVVWGRPYKIPFRNRQDYLFAPDVGAQFAMAALRPFPDGWGVFTLPSHTVDTQGLVELMRRVAQRVGCADAFQIEIGDEEVPFVCDLTWEPFARQFPDAPHTPLESAIERTLAEFQELYRRGWLIPPHD